MDRTKTFSTIIFDLGEVLAGGLLHTVAPLAARLALATSDVMKALGGEPLARLCRGEITESDYLESVLSRQQWPIEKHALQAEIRCALACRVPGMDPILDRVIGRYEVVLHSDHAMEWVAYVRGVHPFLERFDRCFFSFELGHTKDDPMAFRLVLAEIGRRPEHCLFIDDNPRNVEAAASLGIRAVRFTSPATLARAFDELGV